MIAKTIIDLLAKLPEEDLVRMRMANLADLERARGLLRRTEIEEWQLEEAIHLREQATEAGPGSEEGARE